MTPCIFFLASVSGSAATDFEVRVRDGRPIAGEIRSLKPDGALTIGDRTIARGDWYSIRRPDRPLPAWPVEPHVVLTGGDRIAGTVVASDGDALRLRLSQLGGCDAIMRLPVSSVDVVWLTRQSPPAALPGSLTGTRRRDLFVGRNGDAAAGALTGIDADTGTLRYQADGKNCSLSMTNLAAVAFNLDLARVRRPRGPYYRLTLADGTRLSAIALTFDGRGWTVTTAFKVSLQIPGDQLIAVDVEQGPVLRLSGLRPAKYEYVSYSGESYPWAADATITGQPMTLRTAAGETTFDRGLGLHAECTVIYVLAGKYRRLEALAGLDARLGARGDAVLAIHVDGKECPLPRGGRLTNAGPALPIDVDLAGARELTIVLRRGAGGSVQDVVDLAETWLVP